MDGVRRLLEDPALINVLANGVFLPKGPSTQ